MFPRGNGKIKTLRGGKYIDFLYSIEKWRVWKGPLFNNLITPFISTKSLFLAMSSPLSTANPTPAILISNFLASAVRGMPNSLAAQKQRKLLAFTFLSWSPLLTYDSYPFVLDFSFSQNRKGRNHCLAIPFSFCPSENYDRNSHSFLIHQDYLLSPHE